MSDSPLLVKPVGNFLQPAKKGRGWAAQCADNSVLKFAPPATSDGTTYTLPAAKPASHGFLRSDSTGAQTWTSIPASDVTGLAAVATTGAYSSLSGTPTLGSLAALNAAPAGTLTGATLAANVLASSLTSVGIIGSGTWRGSVLDGEFGGTGVANVGRQVTLGGNFTTVGSFNTTLTVGADTNVTLPASGTLAALSGTNTWSGTQTFGEVIVGSANKITWSNDLCIGRQAAANLRLGDADAASPVAQTLSVQSVVAGTSNTAGADFTIVASKPTGSAETGKIILSFYGNGSSGSAVATTKYTWQFTRSALIAPSTSTIGNGSYSSFLSSNSCTSTAVTGNNASCHAFVSAAQTQSNGSDHYDFRHTMTVGPTSGASKFYGASFEHTVNQTGTASGDYTGLRVNLTKTAFLGTNSRLFEGQLAGVPKFEVFDSGNIVSAGSIATADPTSGAGQAWKLGSVKAGVVALDTANYVEVMINGTIKKLLVAA